MKAQLIICPVGANVKHLKVGARVAMEPGASCRVCEPCKKGKYQVQITPNLMDGLSLFSRSIAVCRNGFRRYSSI